MKAALSFGEPQRRITRSAAFALGCLGLSVFFALAQRPLPEPGPENSGMRIRLVVNPGTGGTNETYHVRLDLINVTNKPIRLMGNWQHESERGDFKEYLESDVSIETSPEIIGWMGQAMVGHRTSPQPEYTLKAQETLTLEWTSVGRKLKNKVAHILETKNPTFPTEGLYSVHASIRLCLATNGWDGSASNVSTLPGKTRHPATNIQPNRLEEFENFHKRVIASQPQGNVFLRSNEQLVPIGGSRQLPKYPLGKVTWADTNQNTAAIDLGSLQRVEVGDQFKVWTGYISYNWTLNITRVEKSSSEGRLEPLPHPRVVPGGRSPVPIPVVRGMLAELLPQTTRAAGR